MNQNAVNVICMKWGTLFGPEYVNRLYYGVRRHMSIPFHFVCLTDDATGLDAGIDAKPLPELDVKGSTDLRWRKLTVLSEDLFGLKGPAIFLDLDTVVVGDLAPMFSLPGKFHICRERLLFPKKLRTFRRRLLSPRRYRAANIEGNSSVFRFEIGEFAYVLDRYLRDPAAATRNYRREQDFLTLTVREAGELNYWPDDYCVSFLDGCIPPWPFNYFRDPLPPESARVVVFVNHCSMQMVVDGELRMPFRHIGNVDWLRSAWSDA
jgi:hypothetical protein